MAQVGDNGRRTAPTSRQLRGKAKRKPKPVDVIGRKLGGPQVKGQINPVSPHGGPVQVRIRVPKKGGGTQRHVVDLPSVAQGRALAHRRDVAHKIRATVRDQAAAQEIASAPYRRGDTQAAYDQRKRAVDAQAVKAGRDYATERKKRDDRDIKEVGASRGDPAEAQRYARLAERKAARLAPDLARKALHAGKAGQAVTVAIAQRGKSLSQPDRDRIGAQLDREAVKRAEQRKQDHAGLKDLPRNALAEAKDTTLGAPGAAALVGAATGKLLAGRPKDFAKLAREGAKASPFVQAGQAAVRAAAGHPEQARRDLHQAGQAAAHAPLATALTVAAGAGTAAKVAQSAGAIRKAAVAGRSVKVAYKADQAARRQRAPTQVVTKADGADRVVARVARPKSAHPLVRAVQRDGPKTVKLSSRKGRRVVSKQARREVSLAAEHARANKSAVAKGRKPVTNSAESLAVNLHAAGVLDKADPVASARKVRRGLQRQLDLHHDIAAAADRPVPDVAGLHDQLQRLDDLIAAGHQGPLGKDATFAKGARGRLEARKQDERAQLHQDLKDSEAQRRIRLQAALLRGDIHFDHAKGYWRQVDQGPHGPVLGKRISADQLPAVDGAYLRPPTMGKPGQVAETASKTGHEFTGRELLNGLDFDLGDAQLARERSIGTNIIRQRVRQFALRDADGHPRVFFGDQAAHAVQQLAGHRERWAPFEIKKARHDEHGHIPAHYVLIPAPVKDAWDAHTTAGNVANRVGHAATRRFVRTVLPLSTSWHIGNVADLATRLAVGGARPGDMALRDSVHKAMGDFAGEPAARAVLDSLGGTQSHTMGLDSPRRSAKVLGINFSKGLDRMMELTAPLERGGARLAQGTVLRRIGEELGHEARSHMELGQKIARDLAHDPELIQRFQQETLDIIGDFLTNPARWHGLDPRALLPFLQWIKASNRWVWRTLPAKHPYKTAMLLLAAQATREQRAQLGLSAYWTDGQLARLGLPKFQGPFAGAGIDIGHGATLPVGQWFSLPAAGANLANPAELMDQLVPIVNGTVGGLAAGASTGTKLARGTIRQKLTGQRNYQDRGTAFSGPARRQAVTKLTNAVIPGAGNLHRAALDGAMPLFGSTVIEPKGGKGAGNGSLKSRAVAAVRPTAAQGPMMRQPKDPVVLQIKDGRGRILVPHALMDQDQPWLNQDSGRFYPQGIPATKDLASGQITKGEVLEHGRARLDPEARDDAFAHAPAWLEEQNAERQARRKPRARVKRSG